MIGIEAALLVGLWALFLATVKNKFEHPIMYLPLPVGLLLVCIAARRWLVRGDEASKDLVFMWKGWRVGRCWPYCSSPLLCASTSWTRRACGTTSPIGSLSRRCPWRRYSPPWPKKDYITCRSTFSCSSPLRFPFTSGASGFPLSLWACWLSSWLRKRHAPCGRWAALPVALLLTVSPFHVWFSRDASFYALVTLSAVGTLYFFVRLLRRPRWLLWAGLAFFSSLGLCTHYFVFALPVVCLIYILLTWRKNWKLLRPWMLSQVVAFAPLAPWYAFVVLRRKFYFGSAATQPPRLVDLLYTWRNFSIGNTGDLTWEVPVAVALCGVLLVLAIIQIARTRRGAGRAALLLLWLFLPITMAYLMSFRVPMYVDRYLIPTFPAFILLVVGGMTALPLAWRGGDSRSWCWSVAWGRAAFISIRLTPRRIGVVWLAPSRPPSNRVM